MKEGKPAPPPSGKSRRPAQATIATKDIAPPKVTAPKPKKPRKGPNSTNKRKQGLTKRANSSSADTEVTSCPSEYDDESSKRVSKRQKFDNSGSASDIDVQTEANSDDNVAEEEQKETSDIDDEDSDGKSAVVARDAAFTQVDGADEDQSDTPPSKIVKFSLPAHGHRFSQTTNALLETEEALDDGDVCAYSTYFANQVKHEPTLASVFDDGRTLLPSFANDMTSTSFIGGHCAPPSYLNPTRDSFHEKMARSQAIASDDYDLNNYYFDQQNGGGPWLDVTTLSKLRAQRAKEIEQQQEALQLETFQTLMPSNGGNLNDYMYDGNVAFPDMKGFATSAPPPLPTPPPFTNAPLQSADLYSKPSTEHSTNKLPLVPADVLWYLNPLLNRGRLDDTNRPLRH